MVLKVNSWKTNNGLGVKHTVAIVTIIVVCFVTFASSSGQCGSLKYCEWTNWYSWNCTCCGNDVSISETLASRTRGLCCFQNQTEAECYADCGLNATDKVDHGQCGSSCPYTTQQSACAIRSRSTPTTTRQAIATTTLDLTTLSTHDRTTPSRSTLPASIQYSLTTSRQTTHDQNSSAASITTDSHANLTSIYPANTSIVTSGYRNSSDTTTSSYRNSSSTTSFTSGYRNSSKTTPTYLNSSNMTPTTKMVPLTYHVKNGSETKEPMVDDGRTVSVAEFVGAICGSIFTILIIVGLVLYFVKKRDKSARVHSATSHSPIPEKRLPREPLSGKPIPARTWNSAPLPPIGHDLP